MSCVQTAGPRHNVQVGRKIFECVAEFKYLIKTLVSQYWIHGEINDWLYWGDACKHQGNLSSHWLSKNI